ncbi:hypothetical protein GCM10027317_47300 [Massilia agri]
MDELMAFYQNGLLCMAMSLDAAVEGQAGPADAETGSVRDAATRRLPAATIPAAAWLSLRRSGDTPGLDR